MNLLGGNPTGFAVLVDNNWVACSLMVFECFANGSLYRGFNFGNEPPDFPTTRYTQLGEPRQFGVTVRWEFK